MHNVSPEYLQQFECLGTSCSDTCCQGWNINIDKSTHEKYQRIKIDGVDDIKKYLNKNEQPSNLKYSSIKMNNDGLCPFLGKDKLCKVQKKYGEGFLSDTCKRFPRREVQYDSNKLLTLKLACPEAARLCLTSNDSMNIVEDGIYNTKKIKLVPKQCKSSVSEAGELILNKIYLLFRNDKIEYLNSLIILEKLLDEQMNIAFKLDKFDEIYNFLYETFCNVDLVTVDNTSIKLLFFSDMMKFIDEMKPSLNKNNFKNKKFFDLITESYNELIGRFTDFNEAIENFSNVNKKYFLNFDRKNSYIYRNFFINEILSYSQIFTSPNSTSKNKIYLTMLSCFLSKIILVGLASKAKVELNVDNYVDCISKVDKSFGIFIHSDSNGELYINPKVCESLKKFDNNLFNSLLFLCAH